MTNLTPAGRPRITSPPVTVWLLVALQFLLGVMWAVVVPIYRAPDEPQHIDLARALALGEPYPEAFDRQMSAPMAETGRLGNLSADGTPEPDRQLRYVPGEASPREARPSFSGAADEVPTEYVNQMPQHPPLAYVVNGALLRIVPEQTSWDVQVFGLRMLGALIVAPLPLLAWAGATILLRDQRVAVTAAAFLLTIPQLAHIAGAVNNDTLLILLSAMVAVGICRVLVGNTALSTAIGLGFLAGAALLTKGFALVLPVWILAAYVLLAWRVYKRHKRQWQAAVPVMTAAATSLVTATVVGGWWWFRNLRVYGTVQPDALPRPDAPADFTPDVLQWLQLAGSRLSLRFWGQFGWLETALPWTLVWVLTAAVTVAVGVAVAANRWPTRNRRNELLVLLVPFPLLLAIILPGAWGMYAQTSGPGGLQGRYLYAGLVGLAIVAAAGVLAVLRSRGGHWTPLGLLFGAGVLQFGAAQQALLHWYGPPDSAVQIAWRGLVSWSPLPPAGILMFLWLTAVTGVAAAAALGLAAWRRRVRLPG